MISGWARRTATTRKSHQLFGGYTVDDVLIAAAPNAFSSHTIPNRSRYRRRHTFIS
jgi:hypothetical protein